MHAVSRLRTLRTDLTSSASESSDFMALYRSVFNNYLTLTSVDRFVRQIVPENLHTFFGSATFCGFGFSSLKRTKVIY